MVRLASGAAFEVVDLEHHHLTELEEKVLLHHVENLGYVTSASIKRNTLMVTADFGKLEGEALKQAHAVLKSRATAQVERCKAKKVRLIRHLAHS